MLAFEAGAALRCWAVEVDLAGRTYRIPPRPAADWILTLTTGTLLDVVPGMLDDTGTELDDALENGEVTHQDLVTAAHDAISAAAGLRWWIAVKLVRVLASGEGGVGGELLLHGVDLSRAPLGAVVQAVYRICTRHASEAHVGRLDAMLSAPPAGVSADELYDEDAAADAFEAMARSRGAA